MQFECQSGKLLVGDPGYQRSYADQESDWVLNKKLSAKKGVWKTAVKYDEEHTGRIQYSVAWHSESKVDPFNPSLPSPEIDGVYEEACMLGVDSGTMGYYDYDLYPSGESTGDYGDENTLYGKACKITCDEGDHGVIELNGRKMGFVSRTGYGDGCYSLYIGKNKEGEVVIAKVVFITAREKEMWAIITGQTA